MPATRLIGLRTARRSTDEIVGGLRERRPDLVVCVSCSGRGGLSLEQRAEVLDLESPYAPDMASLTPSSLNFGDGASVTEPGTAWALAERMTSRGIRPEFEVFDLGMANLVNQFVRRGLAATPIYANVLLGNLASGQARFLDIAAIVSALPVNSVYCLAGLGSAQLPTAAMAAAAAPGVRVGLEDNLWLDPQRSRPATNAALVETVHRLADAVGRPIKSSRGLRLRLGLPECR